MSGVSRVRKPAVGGRLEGVKLPGWAAEDLRGGGSSSVIPCNLKRSRQDGVIRQQLIEQLMRDIMNYDAEFRREDSTGTIGSRARH